MGFALPSTMAIGVYNQIIEHGKVMRGSIGVSFTEEQSKNPDRVARTGRAPTVWCCSRSSRAARRTRPGSGGRRGHRDQRPPVKSGSDLVDPIAQTPIGEKVQVSYLRNRQQHDATLTVEDRTKLFPDRAVPTMTQEQQARPSGAPAPAGIRAAASRN